MVLENNYSNQEKIQPLGIIAEKKSWYKRWWGICLIVFLVYFSAMTIAGLFFNNNQEQNSTSADFKNGVKPATDEQLYANSADDPYMGNKAAKVKIVEFGDFQCPYCLQAFPTVRNILSQYGNKIYFVYRDFPVTELHPNAQKAAEAGNCALEQGKFWEMHDKLFINQGNLAVSDLKNYAIALGLDGIKFSVCLDSGKYENEVKQDFVDGYNLGVVGTPTFFINGYRIQGAIPEDIFKQLIDKGLLEN